MRDRSANYDSDSNRDSSPKLKAPQSHQQDEVAEATNLTLDGHLDMAAAFRRRRSDEASEELFPGFVEEERHSRESELGLGQQTADAPPFAISVRYM